MVKGKYAQLSKSQNIMNMIVGYEFHKNYFDLWLTLDSISMTKAEKLLEYTWNLFYLVKLVTIP